MNFSDQATVRRLKALVPSSVKQAYWNAGPFLNRMWHYNMYDSSDYWRNRAREKGQARVLWRNEEYNRIYRILQQSILADILARHHPATRRVLDIGCGVGVVATMLLELCPEANIDAVDFEEMVSIARLENARERIAYIPSAAEDYLDPDKHYDVILSSGCFSAIRNLVKLEQALRNAAAMLDKGGILVMIDPFHRWSFLARARISSREVVRFMASCGLKLVLKSGVLFWPYRELLANSGISGPDLERRFRTGERLLRLLGRHLWADYKILVFSRD